MSDTSTPTSYDFRRPRQLPDDRRTLLSSWREAVAFSVTERWNRQLSVQVSWQPAEFEMLRRSDLIDMVVPEMLTYAVSLGADSACMWLMLPRPFVLGVLALMLGDAITELPADRSPTDLETSLIELAVQEVVGAMQDAQSAVVPLTCRLLGERRAADAKKDYSEQEPIACIRWTASATFGTGEVRWCLSQAAVNTYIESLSDGQATERTDRSGILIDTLRQVPLEVVVHLGSTQVHVAELLNLQPGDIVVLDQRINEPLTAAIAGAPKFLGWPGKIGSRQALKISAMVTSKDVET